MMPAGRPAGNETRGVSGPERKLPASERGGEQRAPASVRRANSAWFPDRHTSEKQGPERNARSLWLFTRNPRRYSSMKERRHMNVHRLM